VLQKLGRFEEAVASYSAAVALEPEGASAAKTYFNMGTALLNVPLPAAADAQDVISRDAEAAFKAATSIDGTMAKAYNNLGNAIHRQHGTGRRSEAAIEAYSAALAALADPKDKTGSSNPSVSAEASFNLGVAYEEAGRLQDSFTAFEIATEFKSDYASAYNNMGLILEQAEDLEGATQQYMLAIWIDKMQAGPYINLGNALSKQPEKVDDALKAYAKALAIDPSSAEANVNKAHALEHKGDLPGAEAALRIALDTEPSMAEGHAFLAHILREANDGREVEATQCQAEAERLNPKVGMTPPAPTQPMEGKGASAGLSYSTKAGEQAEEAVRIDEL
jgi:tetratricopeptide (TPR) repeat protein